MSATRYLSGRITLAFTQELHFGRVQISLTNKMRSAHRNFRFSSIKQKLPADPENQEKQRKRLKEFQLLVRE